MIQSNLKIGIVTLTLLGLLVGCAHERRLFYPHTDDEDRSFAKKDAYASFIKNNIELKEIKYSNEYVDFEFIVDTDYGSTIIQNLIDIPAAKTIIEAHNLIRTDKLNAIEAVYKHLSTLYEYNDEPAKWISTGEVIAQKKGNCKNLSILMLSMLLAMHIDAHAAISNGHMWVNVNLDERMFIIEIDQDKERNKIYSIKGFYEYPLYKIYKDHSLKRKVKID